jgi:hypothetical protein
MDEVNISPLRQALIWIGYDVVQAQVLEDELGDLTTMGIARGSEIADVLKTYSTRTAAAGRITSGLVRIKRMQALAHWVRDFKRVNKEATIDGLDAVTFLTALSVSEERAKARETDKDTAEARAKEASPGKLTSEKDWEKWETRLVNQLSILQGVLGVPLVYVIREDDTVDQDPERVFDTFTEECIAKCPLTGPSFEADARTVHQLIESYTSGENSEVWVKRLRRHHNGRMDMEALRAHYRGEGNQSRRISDAETLRDTLNYRGESTMPFATFLAKVQRMFNLFEQIGEPYSEAAKLRFLFDKVQNQELKHPLEAVRTLVSMNPDSFTFTSAANHLSALIKPRAKRELAAVTFSGDDNGDTTPILKNGKIHTGYYSNWYDLSKENRNLVLAERDKQGKGPSKNTQSGDKSGKSGKRWKKTVHKLRKKIAALKRKPTGDASSEDDNDAPQNNAGNSFGGRSEKAAGKKPRNN